MSFNKNINFCPLWQQHLEGLLSADYFEVLFDKLGSEYENHQCYPPLELIFSAFNYCSFNDVKVVIIGQDPYHGAGQANGLAFSVSDEQKIPPSLLNIFKEINNDLDQALLPTSGNLEGWATQGVLLLNNTLTVRAHMANSHKHLQWDIFTAAIIELISTKKDNIVFMLWGNFAQKKGTSINENKHLILKASHPSPMAANQGKWFGNKHFSKANYYLQQHGKTAINWT